MTEHHQHALPKGYKLGRYSIEAVLGAGGFAITYLAQHTGLDQKVAIKEYLPDAFGLRIEGKTTVRAKRGEENEFAWGLDRFAEEARTLSKFNHPSIVPVTDIFEDNGTAYMVMPYQEGESLEERLDRDSTLPEPALRKLFDPLIDALSLVHASEILHRDIKPANIFIRSDGTAVLLDFGNARQALGTKSQSLTATLTPGYAPNEQYTSRGKQGPWTDVYSLGATLYKATVGDMPPEAPERAMEDSYVPAATAAEGKYAPALLAAIDKSLAFLPEDRPQDMAAFKRLLKQPIGANETSAPAKQEAASATLLPRESEPLANPSQQILELRELEAFGTRRVLKADADGGTNRRKTELGVFVALLVVTSLVVTLGLAVWVFRVEFRALLGMGQSTTVWSKSGGAKTQESKKGGRVTSGSTYGNAAKARLHDVMLTSCTKRGRNEKVCRCVSKNIVAGISDADAEAIVNAKKSGGKPPQSAMRKFLASAFAAGRTCAKKQG